MEEKAYDLLSYGRYQKAKELYLKLLENSESAADKAHFRSEIASCDRYIREISQIGIGEACFPVYYEPIDAAIPLTAVVSKHRSENTPQYLADTWDAVKPLLTAFLDRYLLEKVRSVVVFDWGLDEYSISIKKLPNHDSKYDDIVNNLSGESIMLSVFMAALSVIINKPISNTVAFSASLANRNNNIVVQRINDKSIPAKLRSINEERPWIDKLFIPYENDENEQKVYRVDEVKKIIEDIFPDFGSELKENQGTLGRDDGQNGKRSMVLKEYDDVETNSGEIHYYLYFKHGKVLLEDIHKIIEYFRILPDMFVRQEKGVIIDGLRMNFMVPLLLLQQTVFNHVSNFVAIRYTGYGTSNEAIAIVVRTGNMNKTRELGEVIRYRLPY